MDPGKFLISNWCDILFSLFFFLADCLPLTRVCRCCYHVWQYRRVARPGLNFKLPFLESVYRKVSIQNRSVELEFQAVTADQANVYFKAMLLYSVSNHDEETIKNVAFKFIADRDLMQALVRTIEGNIRAHLSQLKNRLRSSV